MFRKIKERPFYFMLLTFLTGLLLGLNLSIVRSAEEPAHKYLDYFHQIYQIIRSEYVEEPDTKNLFYGAIRGMFGALDDPFSRFLDEKAYEELQEVTTGQFVGVGIEITIQDDEIVVISPIEDSPAMKAGIRSGDIITKIDDTDVAGKDLSGIVKRIKGKPKTRVVLSVKREGFDSNLEFDLERAPIKIKNVDYAMLENSGIGYLKIKNFGAETASDAEDAIRNLTERGAQKLIVDLRYNPGGLVSAATGLSDLFLEKGQVIVSTRGRNGSENQQVYTSENEPLAKQDLIVLVNRGSASASEIFAGAMRDNSRGKLLGEKTFGKGSVQKTYQLDDSIGAAVTIAKYYTPGGEMIHKKGIIPDYVVEQENVTNEDMAGLKTINETDVLKAFPASGKTYSEETKASFRQFLKDKGIVLSSRTADYILKEQIYMYKKKPVYDLEFDRQLSRAAEILGFDQEKK